MAETETNIIFRVAAEDKAAWKEAAHQSRVSLSRWIRDACMERMGGTAVVPPVDTFKPKKPTARHAKSIAGDLLSKAASMTTSTCNHRLPKGTFCKRCGRTH